MSARTVILILTSAALGACATGAQRQAQAIGGEIKLAKQELLACNDAIWNNPLYGLLTEHLPKDIRDATILQLSDDSRLSPDQRPLFSQLYSDSTQCRKAATEHFANAIPGAVPALLEQQSALDEAALALADQKISWGEFNQRRKAAYATLQPKLTAAMMEVRDELVAENANEVAQRQAAVQSFMNYYQNQQLINAMNRPQVIQTAPTYTTCNSFGNQTNCSTH